jgi:hypothetical protein
MIEPARTMITGVLHETRTRGGKDEVLAMGSTGARKALAKCHPPLYLCKRVKVPIDPDAPWHSVLHRHQHVFPDFRFGRGDVSC